MMIKRAFTFVLATVIIFTLLSQSVFAIDSKSAPDVNADAAILLNVNTDEIVFEKNSEQKVYPASSVKIMTAIVVFDNITNLDTLVSVPQEAISKYSGNKISIVADEQFTVRDLLYALLNSAANDAADALAYFVGGSIENFVSMMNAKAKSLGAENTVYTNPTGVHDKNMYTTAYDTALIAKYACCNSTLVEMASSKSYVIKATNKSKQRTLYNKNLIISQNSSYYYKDAKGLNAGYTVQAGYNLISMATEKGIPLLCVVLSCDKTKDGVIHSYKDAISLYKWAFGSYEYIKVLKAKQVNYEMPVKLSVQADYVLLYPDNDIELLMPAGINPDKDIQKVYSLQSEYLEAPVKKDVKVGEILIVYNEEVIAKANLLTASDIERTEMLYYLQIIENATATTWFKVSITTFIVLTAIYIILSLISSKKKKEIVNVKRKKRY